MFIYKPTLKCLSSPISLLSSRIGAARPILAFSRVSGRNWATSPAAIARTSFRAHHGHATNLATLRPARTGPRSLGLLLGAACTFLVGHTVYNDAVLPAAQIHSNSAARYKSSTTYTKERFGLNYEELTIGSVTGLFLGIIVGKLSSVLVLLGLSLYFLVQFLESRNIVNIPWNSVINIGKNKVNVKELVLQNTSFKLAFVLTFLVAAYNI